MYKDYLFYLKDFGSFVVKTNFKSEEDLCQGFIEWTMQYGLTEEQVLILMNLGYAFYSTDLELPKEPELKITPS